MIGDAGLLREISPEGAEPMPRWQFMETRIFTPYGDPGTLGIEVETMRYETG